jgi:hypothetical protein
MKISLSLFKGEIRESSSVWQILELNPTLLLKIEGLIVINNFDTFILITYYNEKLTGQFNKINLTAMRKGGASCDHPC